MKKVPASRSGEDSEARPSATLGSAGIMMHDVSCNLVREVHRLLSSMIRLSLDGR